MNQLLRLLSYGADREAFLFGAFSALVALGESFFDSCAGGFIAVGASLDEGDGQVEAD